jgi:hypothetical protein
MASSHKVQIYLFYMADQVPYAIHKNFIIALFCVILQWI